MDALEKRQDVLRELCKCHCAGLDFGISCILDGKREPLRNGANEHLPRPRCGELHGGALCNGRTPGAVLPRDMQGPTDAGHAREGNFVAARVLTDSADTLFANGGPLISGGECLDPVLKCVCFQA